MGKSNKQQNTIHLSVFPTHEGETSGAKKSKSSSPLLKWVKGYSREQNYKEFQKNCEALAKKYSKNKKEKIKNEK